MCNNVCLHKKNIFSIYFTGLSVSMASLYSEADLSKHPLPRTGTDVAMTETVVSAEGVALSLLRQFSERHLPRASDLQWLVSEQDAPQQVQFCRPILILRSRRNTYICAVVKKGAVSQNFFDCSKAWLI
jgi:hypothetical protein